MCLISVIIPFYNNSATIERALNSVTNQTVQDFEILLINDDSPDWSLAEAKLGRFKSENFKILHHQRNRNGAAARNTGINNAKGRYTAFLDADDEWINNHLEESLLCIEKRGADLVYCRSKVLSNFNYILPNKGIKRSERVGDYLFINQQAIFTSSILVKAEISKEVLFKEHLRRHQDYDFLLRFEAFGYHLEMSNHLGNIMHWEDYNPEAKGGTWEFSLRWVKEYRHYLSKNAYSNFVFQFVFLKLLRQWNIKNALQIGCTEFNWLRVTKRNLFLLGYILLYERFIKKI